MPFIDELNRRIGRQNASRNREQRERGEWKDAEPSEREGRGRDYGGGSHWHVLISKVTAAVQNVVTATRRH